MPEYNKSHAAGLLVIMNDLLIFIVLSDAEEKCPFYVQNRVFLCFVSAFNSQCSDNSAAANLAIGNELPGLYDAGPVVPNSIIFRAALDVPVDLQIATSFLSFHRSRCTLGSCPRGLTQNRRESGIFSFAGS